ncbi:MAG TPA: GH25 family lysozyme [Mycobacteriales bacterium]|nr:GH25 family lysozyme [Mycobacteriales bacterium]
MSRPSIRRRLAVGLVPFVSAALVAGSASAAAASVSGPDIASYQHPNGAAISWSSVYASGQRFVFVKATEGGNYRNPYFAGDWAGSRAAGLLHGAYHFARPNARSGSAAAQARAFVATAGRARAAGELPPTLDLEVTGGLGPTKLIAWTKQWLTTVQNLTGRKPMIYSYPYFWAHNMRGTTLFRDHRLWGANYGSTPTTFGGAWSTWTFWQYSSTSRVSGIHAKTDMNKFHGTLRQLRALANITTTTTSTATTPRTSTTTTSTTSTSTTTKVATRLSINTPDSAGAWQPFDVTGRLTRDGVGVAGKTLHLRGRLVGSDNWIDLQSVVTDSTGRWKHTIHAPADAQVQALFSGTSRLAASSSRIATITVDGGHSGGGYYQH